MVAGTGQAEKRLTRHRSGTIFEQLHHEWPASAGPATWDGHPRCSPSQHFGAAGGCGLNASVDQATRVRASRLAGDARLEHQGPPRSQPRRTTPCQGTYTRRPSIDHVFDRTNLVSPSRRRARYLSWFPPITTLAVSAATSRLRAHGSQEITSAIGSSSRSRAGDRSFSPGEESSKRWSSPTRLGAPSTLTHRTRSSSPMRSPETRMLRAPKGRATRPMAGGTR